MGKIALASGAYSAPTTSLPDRICENALIDKSRTMPDGEGQVVTRWGSLALPSWAGNARGYSQADGFASGKVIVVVGSEIKTFDPVTLAVGTIPGTIPGTDRVVISYTERKIGILGGGVFSAGTAVQIRQVTDGILDDPNLAIGSTVQNVAIDAFDFSINGTTYSKGAVAAGTAPGATVVPISKFGAVAFDIGINGVIDAISATDNATGYTTAAEAILGLPDPAVEHIRIGVVTASKSDGSFTFGTTALNAANTTVAYTDALVDTSWTDLLADHDQTGFTDLTSIGQRFILIYGSRLCFSDVTDDATQSATTSVLNYYTAEYAPDGLVACDTFGERLPLLGRQTIEPWEETGSLDDPLRRSLGQVIQVGCRARDSVRVMDGALYWVDQNNQVRRTGNALTPDTLSGPDVARMLAATAEADILGIVIEFEGHALYAPRTPTSCPLYDANYGEWTRFFTLQSDTWRYGYSLRVNGNLYVGDAAGVGFALMHPDYKSEHMPDASTMGTEIDGGLSGYILTDKVRPMGKLRWEGSKGIGLPTGQGVTPEIRMRRSLKGPKQFSAWRPRSIGAQGEYDRDVSWQQNGIIYPPGTSIEIRWSDPVAPITTGLYEDA